jgi:predicted esterase
LVQDSKGWVETARVSQVQPQESFNEPEPGDIADEQTGLHDLRKNIGSMIGRIAQNKFSAPSRAKREEVKLDRYQKASPIKVPRIAIPPSGHLEFALQKTEPKPSAQILETNIDNTKELLEKALHEEKSEMLISGRGSASSRGNTVRKLKAEKQGSSVKIRRSLENFSELSRECNQYDLFSENPEHVEEDRKLLPEHVTKEKPGLPFGARISLSLKKDQTVAAFSRMKTSKISEPLRSIKKTSSVAVDSRPVHEILTEAKNTHCQKILHQIPCLIFRSVPPEQLEHFVGLVEEDLSNKLVIFFHCNGEDLADALPVCRQIAASLNINFLAVEYPGYSLYENREANEENILRDAEAVVDFMLDFLSIHPKDVFVLGRSIGSGPSIHVASKYEVGGVLLISAFCSIGGVIRDNYGRVANFLIKERFDNLSKIERVKCPVVLVHGQKDEMVSVEHAIKLQGRLL